MAERWRDRLRRRREEAGLSQRALASRLGLSHVMLHHLERGTRVLSGRAERLLEGWSPGVTAGARCGACGALVRESG